MILQAFYLRGGEAAGGQLQDLSCITEEDPLFLADNWERAAHQGRFWCRALCGRAVSPRKSIAKNRAYQKEQRGYLPRLDLRLLYATLSETNTHLLGGIDVSCAVSAWALDRL